MRKSCIYGKSLLFLSRAVLEKGPEIYLNFYVEERYKGSFFFMNMKMRSSKRNSIKSKRQNIENFSYFLHDYVMFDPCLLIHNVKQEWVLKFRVTHNSILFLFFNQVNTSHCHRLIFFLPGRCTVIYCDKIINKKNYDGFTCIILTTGIGLIYAKIN